jgi:hypothetical protein
MIKKASPTALLPSPPIIEKDGIGILDARMRRHRNVP